MDSTSEFVRISLGFFVDSMRKASKLLVNPLQGPSIGGFDWDGITHIDACYDLLVAGNSCVSLESDAQTLVDKENNDNLEKM